MPEMPEKSQYKLSEVCQFTDTQPYVLRFWESEFPQLRPEKTRSGQPVYSRAPVAPASPMPRNHRGNGRSRISKPESRCPLLANNGPDSS